MSHEGHLKATTSSTQTRDLGLETPSAQDTHQVGELRSRGLWFFWVELLLLCWGEEHRCGVLLCLLMCWSRTVCHNTSSTQSRGRYSRMK